MEISYYINADYAVYIDRSRIFSPVKPEAADPRSYLPSPS